MDWPFRLLVRAVGDMVVIVCPNRSREMYICISLWLMAGQMVPVYSIIVMAGGRLMMNLCIVIYRKNGLD